MNGPMNGFDTRRCSVQVLHGCAALTTVMVINTPSHL